MVHQYQLNGYNIVLDSCSGSVHVVDEVAYDVIAMYKEHSADEIVAAMLAKYADRPDVTEPTCASASRTWPLWKPPASFGLPTSTRTWLSTSKTARPWSRRSASTSPTPATSTAPTASPRRAAIRVTAP